MRAVFFSAVAAISFCLSSHAEASLIGATDFSGRSVAGPTASDITWSTLKGITDPGPLTAVDVNSTGNLAGLFNTGPAQGHFAPNLNTGDEGPWSVSVPLNFAPGTVSLAIEEVVIDWQFFSNAGALQSPLANRPTRWTANLIGSSSGQVDSTFSDTGSGQSGVQTLTFGAPATLSNAETWTLLIQANGLSPNLGNNTGIDALSFSGTVVVPEPTSLLGLVGLLSAAFLRRRRRCLGIVS